eukprot:3909143-Amphidinium_carterae.1
MQCDACGDVRARECGMALCNVRGDARRRPGSDGCLVSLVALVIWWLLLAAAGSCRRVWWTCFLVSCLACAAVDAISVGSCH